MPKTKRDMLRRHLGGASYHIKMTGAQLNVLEDAFREQHPEEADTLLTLMGGCATMLDVLTKLCEKWGWGEIQERSWRNLSPEQDTREYGDNTPPPPGEG